MNLRHHMRRLTDGAIPQAVIAGSLSFAHIHDLAAHHGQAGWKAWTYPLSVDLLTVAAYHKLLMAQRGHATRGVKALAWCWFLLALAASLAANVAATGGGLVSVAVGVWPAVAFLGCTLLGHTTTTPVQQRHSVEHVTVERLTLDTPTPPPTTTTGSGMEVPAPLLEFARRIATDYQARTGNAIDAQTLRTRLGVTQPLADAVHHQLGN